MKLYPSLFLIAIPALVDARRPVELNYQEELGQCRGATCSVWGDPHIITCDGLSYDCQGTGLFTIMKNHMYNIQGHFTDMGVAARRYFEAKGKKFKSTVTNDVMIDFLQSPDPENKAPVLQFSFGNITKYDGQIISEKGCKSDFHFDPLVMPSMTTKKVEKFGTVQGCRKHCEETEGCTQFSYWADTTCRLNDNNQTETANPGHWSRSVTGTLDSECGTRKPLPQLLSDEEEAIRGQIGNRCPLLFLVDGEMVDLSEYNPENPNVDSLKRTGYILGDENSDVSVFFINRKLIRIRYILESGDTAEVHLKAGGHGPGELFGCAFNTYVCLPESEEELFRAGGLGLLGTPNGDTSDDWMTPVGETLPINMKGLRRQSALDYCVDNWCVSQVDSIMTPTGGQTYEDVKCEAEEFIDFDIDDPGCVLSKDKIIERCENEPSLLKFACELDCCVGGCDEMEEVTDEIVGMKTLSEDEDDIQYDVPRHSDCGDKGFVNTGETVCPRASGSAVKLLHSAGEIELPKDAVVFYGIEMDVDPHDEMNGKAVRFKVNNFLNDRANIYVKHEKSSFSRFLDPVCTTMDAKVGGCDETPKIIEAGCYDYDGVTPFVLVTVYVQSGEIDPSEVGVDQCCDEKPLFGSGVAEFTFQIECECPPEATA